MKYLLCIKNQRTGNITAIYVPILIPEGTIIKWGCDEHNPDGLGLWKVTRCEEQ